jgi:hypothetical protein
MSATTQAALSAVDSRLEAEPSELDIAIQRLVDQDRVLRWRVQQLTSEVRYLRAQLAALEAGP